MRKAILFFTLLSMGMIRGFAQCDPATPVTMNNEGGSSRESSDRSSLLVSTTWLADHLKDPSLVLIQIGPKEGYEAGHIAGARFLSLMDISTPSGKGLTLELPKVDELKSTLEGLGISNNSRIVLYYGTDWVSPTTRVFFTLDYLGLGDRTSILDGGLPVWRAEGHPVTKELPKVQQGSLTPHPRPSVVVDAAWVSSNLNNHSVAIIDARAPEYYSGTSAGKIRRAGHIPGAMNVPYSSLLDDSNKLKTPDELRAAFLAANIKPDSHIVSYCHIGQQATVVYFVARYLGYEPSLYDGSFEDWSARTELPVTTAGSGESGRK
ncbi:MAG: sulfurtransferase [Acidobacteriia bacterium]|nr:sulfurtransferase [Terriglobia bacterium]